MQSVIETPGQRAARHPEWVTLLCGGRRVTFGELLSRVVAAACYLSDCGVRVKVRDESSKACGPRRSAHQTAASRCAEEKTR